MGSRMDKYKNSNENIPTRSSKNKELYKQIYNAYDDFENLIVPSNSREITMSDLKKEITSRSEYREKKELANITSDKNEEPLILYKERKEEKTNNNQNNVYDINELLNKAIDEKKEEPNDESKISNGDYLKKLKLDKRKTNIEQVKEMYADIKEDKEEDESLLKTANLSLEILSDLKSDNDATMVSAPIKNEELPEDSENDFYSNNYKFSKRDFEDKDYKPDDEEEDDDDDFQKSNNNGKFFLKVLLLIFGILLIAGVLFFIIKYLNKV